MKVYDQIMKTTKSPPLLEEIFVFTSVNIKDVVKGTYNFTEAPFELVEGEAYTIVFDGVAYLCTATKPTKGPYLAYIGGIDPGAYAVVTDCPVSLVRTSTDGYFMFTTSEESEHTVAVYRGAVEPEEPTAPIGYIEYLVNPKYHMGKPFRGFIGWKLAQKGGSADEEPALVSSDGYTLQDVNGLNLIPKEGK